MFWKSRFSNILFHPFIMVSNVITSVILFHCDMSTWTSPVLFQEIPLWSQSPCRRYHQAHLQYIPQTLTESFYGHFNIFFSFIGSGPFRFPTNSVLAKSVPHQIRPHTCFLSWNLTELLYVFFSILHIFMWKLLQESLDHLQGVYVTTEGQVQIKHYF